MFLDAIMMNGGMYCGGEVVFPQVRLRRLHSLLYFIDIWG